jgi:hypothetical protein
MTDLQKNFNFFFMAVADETLEVGKWNWYGNRS